jgi:hypothetical protein
MFDTAEVLRMFVATLGGGIVIGYLLTDWWNEKTIDRQGEQIDSLADEVESLVAKNDEAAVKLRQYEAIFGANAIDSYATLVERNANQAREIQQLESLLQLTPEV